jgi:hypothetical protein
MLHKRQEILGRTYPLLFFNTTRTAPKATLVTIISCRGNVFAELLRSNDMRDTHTEAQTGHRWDGLRCRHKDWLRHSEVDSISLLPPPCIYANCSAICSHNCMACVKETPLFLHKREASTQRTITLHKMGQEPPEGRDRSDSEWQKGRHAILPSTPEPIGHVGVRSGHLNGTIIEGFLRASLQTPLAVGHDATRRPH